VGWVEVNVEGHGKSVARLMRLCWTMRQRRPSVGIPQCSNVLLGIRLGEVV
jgi:hypothetical protein